MHPDAVPAAEAAAADAGHHRADIDDITSGDAFRQFDPEPKDEAGFAEDVDDGGLEGVTSRTFNPGAQFDDAGAAGVCCKLCPPVSSSD